jgi:hypothetical protein
MNPKMIIYIILSAILLYLYYRKRDLSILFAFIVLVSFTLIFGTDVREGAKGGNEECEKLGFTAPKIVKDDDGNLGESLDKEMKKIKNVADKYWPYNQIGESKDEKEQKSISAIIELYGKEIKENELSEEDSKNAELFMNIGKQFYYKVIDKNEKLKVHIDDLPKGYLKPFISGGNTLLKILEKISKSNKLKDTGAKKVIKYLICLCKHWISIHNKLDGMTGGKKGDSNKNKKSKSKKKSKKKDDEDDEDD